MRIYIDIPAERIADLMVAATEYHRSAATWCLEIRLQHSKFPDADPASYWYGRADLYRLGSEIIIEVLELIDDTKPAEDANVGRHIVKLDQIRNGLTVMADKAPRQFAAIMASEYDSETADHFLQLISLGEVRYA